MILVPNCLPEISPVLIRILRTFTAIIALAVCSPAFSNQPDARQLLHLLDYIAVEYPEFVRDGRVLDANEYQEQVEFSDQVARGITTLPRASNQSALHARAVRLHEAIVAKAESGGVVEQARALQRDLISTFNLRVAPSTLPDMQRAQAIYQASCASCHGAAGDGKGPAASGLDPAPTDFTDRGRAARRSVLGLFNTISLGVEGTAMTAFSHLSDDERWALAFHVSQYSASDAERQRGATVWSASADTIFSTVDDLVSTTPEEAAKRSENDYHMLAHLRAHPELLFAAGQSDTLVVAEARIRDSAAFYSRGEREAAYKAALAAYLDGFELAEARLSSHLRNRVEAKMVAFRSLLRSDAPTADVRAAADDLILEFAAARARLSESRAETGTSFAAAFIILLREGLEAMLVVAAIAAFLIRSGRRDALSYVHFGWIAALAAGGVTWAVSTTVFAFSGAQRETTEGITALLAAAVLLYGGYWLHSKRHASRWQSFIRGEVSGVLSSGQLWGLATISFLAVYREAFETVLFMQTLWLQADAAGRSGLLGGLGAGAAVLTVTAWLITRFSAKLPLGLFFAASAAFLAALAVVFAGKGIAALQAAGKLPMSPVGWPGLPALGIYPNLQGLILQGALLLLIAAGLWFTRTPARRA
jgi:high-affinity iron transporter